MTPHDYWHYGPETVTIVEAMLAGAEFAEVRRLTWDGQPASSFNEFRHVRLYGELLAWVFARLEIPPSVAARLFDNAARPLLLGTMAPGAQTLAELRRHPTHARRETPNHPAHREDQRDHAARHTAAEGRLSRLPLHPGDPV